MKLGRSRITEANVDLTPMVDVVLLLVVFFMLTTQFARTQQSPLELPPQPGEKVRQAARHSIVIDMARDGRLMVLGATVDLQSLAEDVQQQRSIAGPGLEIIVRADRTASAAHLNALAEALASAGVRHWQLATAGESR
jgi:biopolymer transport protein ExbD